MRSAAWSAAEAAARESYGRLLAWLATQWRDVQAAEDALSDAFLAALRTWPESGVPQSPDAWLLTAARRNLLHAHRHRKVVEEHTWSRWLDGADTGGEDDVPPAVPDERLRLMYVCAHPAIDPAVHAALMLQTVLGVDARAIASALLISPAAMAQRLVRAKARIRETGLRFEEPERSDLPGRTQAVLEAIYAAYALSSDRACGDGLPSGLAAEALYLARVLTTLSPDSTEAAGLLALLLFCESRADAREIDGVFTPLHAQDTARWNRARIDEANRILWQAAALRQPGPFQLEAAIQSAHAQRAYTGTVPWTAIAALYAQLLRIAPGIGARVAQAAAIAEAESPAAGLALLNDIAPAAVDRYQPYWATRAHLLAGIGDRDTASAAYARAIGLTESPAIRRFLQRRCDALTSR